jgi:hypothetical protein
MRRPKILELVRSAVSPRMNVVGNNWVLNRERFTAEVAAGGAGPDLRCVPGVAAGSLRRLRMLAASAGWAGPPADRARLQDHGRGLNPSGRETPLAGWRVRFCGLSSTVPRVCKKSLRERGSMKWLGRGPRCRRYEHISGTTTWARWLEPDALARSRGSSRSDRRGGRPSRGVRGGRLVRRCRLLEERP